MLVIGVLGFFTFVGGSILWHVQRKETQLRTMQKEQAEAERRFLGLKVKAEQGDDMAQHSLGVGYLYGQGVKQNLPEAVEWIRKAAEQNNANAQSMLGHNYANGHGVVTNLVEAYAWHNLAATTYTRLAGARDALALAMSPEQIAAGRKRTEELHRQIEAKLKIQAERGGLAAQNRLGNMYYFGQGLAKNDSEAVKWYRKAAEQGVAIDYNTHNTLAWILAVSKDAGLRDGKEAVKWATKACAATGNKNWATLDTLAAAFAEAGDFSEAVKHQQMALDRLTVQQVVSRAQLQDRLKLYQQGLPYRE